MKNRLIAKRYTNAFLENISKEEYKKTLEDICVLKKLFENNEEAISILNLFIFPKKDRDVIFQSISKELILKKRWLKLFDLLICKQKLSILNDLLDELEKEILSRQNKIKVDLKVVHKLDNSTKEKIINYISKIYNKDIILNIIEDKEIVGGFIAETEDEIIDGSIKHNLDKFKQFVNNLG